MLKFTDRHVSKIAMAVVAGGFFLASPARADDAMAMHRHGPEHVEERIKTLHDKLGLTSDQEDEWRKVARIMRENETDIHKLVEERHENDSATAVDDLQSYEAIADAHAEGLKKLIPAFETLYDDLTDEQKANADRMFGKFEGHESRKARTNAAPNE